MKQVILTETTKKYMGAAIKSPDAGDVYWTGKVGFVVVNHAVLSEALSSFLKFDDKIKGSSGIFIEKPASKFTGVINEAKKNGDDELFNLYSQLQKQVEEYDAIFLSIRG